MATAEVCSRLLYEHGKHLIILLISRENKLYRRKRYGHHQRVIVDMRFIVMI